jgi:hypothetical protein
VHFKIRAIAAQLAILSTLPSQTREIDEVGAMGSMRVYTELGSLALSMGVLALAFFVRRGWLAICLIAYAIFGLLFGFDLWSLLRLAI